MHGSFFYSFKYELQICTSCNAGASFVPSPVTATTWPLFLRALTRRSLSLGDDRAITCNVEVWLVPVERSSQQQEHTLNNIRYYVLQGSNKNTCPTYMMRQKVRNASTNSARKLEHNQKRTKFCILLFERKKFCILLVTGTQIQLFKLFIYVSTVSGHT